jgi:hypothetical protein
MFAPPRYSQLADAGGKNTRTAPQFANKVLTGTGHQRVTVENARELGPAIAPKVGGGTAMNCIVEVLRIGVLGVVLVSTLTPAALVAQDTQRDVKHIDGTVVKVEPTSITIKTADGEVTLSFDEKVNITLNDKPGTVADLKEGQQVTVSIDGAKAVAIKVGTESA